MLFISGTGNTELARDSDWSAFLHGRDTITYMERKNGLVNNNMEVPEASVLLGVTKDYPGKLLNAINVCSSHKLCHNYRVCTRPHYVCSEIESITYRAVQYCMPFPC